MKQPEVGAPLDAPDAATTPLIGAASAAASAARFTVAWSCARAAKTLAESVLFTHLDQVGVGDRFTLEVAGEVLTYEVDTVRIVAPTETDWLLVDPDLDLVTLITRDPLGINTERMLVAGERVIPTPVEDIEGAMQRSDQPRFPWWLVAAVAAVLVLGGLARWARKPTVVAAAGKDDDEDEEESEESPSSQSQMLAGDLG